MNYIKSLDGVRGLAIGLVLLFHFFYIVECGWIGVQLFFVLSGYLITSILLKSKENTLSFYLKRFYWRRSLRIFPLYFAYVLFFLVVFLVMSYPVNFKEVAPYLFTYTYNFQPWIEGKFEIDAVFTPFWSLSVEEQFYLIWPFLIFFLNQKQIKWVVLVIIFFSPALRYFFGEYLIGLGIYDAEAVGEIVYRMTFLQLDAFAVGAAVPLFALNDKIKKPGNFALIVFGITVLAGLLNYFSISGLGHKIGLSSLGYPIGGIENLQHVWSYTLINLSSLGLIMYLVNTKDSKFGKLAFENNVMVAIGKVSYGMYVYHWVIMAAHRKFIHPYIGNLMLSFLVYTVIVYIVSYISFELFEKRFIKLKDVKFGQPKVA